MLSSQLRDINETLPPAKAFWRWSRLRVAAKDLADEDEPDGLGEDDGAETVDVEAEMAGEGGESRGVCGSVPFARNVMAAAREESDAAGDGRAVS